MSRNEVGIAEGLSLFPGLSFDLYLTLLPLLNKGKSVSQRCCPFVLVEQQASTVDCSDHPFFLPL